MPELTGSVTCGKAATAIAMMCLLQEGRITRQEYVSLTHGMDMADLLMLEVVVAGIKETVMAKLRSRSN